MSQIASLSLEEESKKNPELKVSDIESLKKWCEKQPHLPTISDSSLALFLHSNYYLMEPTKTTIDSYYTIKSFVPEFFTNRNPSEVRQSFGYTSMLALKATTKDGYNILFATLNDPDPSKFNLNDFSKFLFMVLDLWLYRAGTTKGHHLVLDVQNVRLGHALRISPAIMKKFIFYLQDGLPVRLKGLHYLNTNPGMEAVLKIMRPFFKKEILDTTYMHSTVKSLEKFLPIEALPYEWGGKAGSLAELHEAGVGELEDYRDWFIEEESRGRVDETKRPGKAKSASDVFGVDGSFKKLDELD